jgi:ABC-type phosphate/phosphonate transport system substrate-binding protein
MMLPKIIKTILPFLCIFFWVANTHANSQKELTFGVVPQQAANKLARNWGPSICSLICPNWVKN